MVKLNRIYTKSGDDGHTALGAGGRVSKSDPRVAAYGSVDELNAAVGLAAAECDRAAPNPTIQSIRDQLVSMQQDLFDLGADLCVPQGAEHKGTEPLRITPGQTQRLEPLIDALNEDLAPLTSFVLPGGAAPSAALHLARTVCRRAERLVVALREADPAATGPEPVRYLNRLSDLLFVMARAANHALGPGDTLWKPASNRDNHQSD